MAGDLEVVVGDTRARVHEEQHDVGGGHGDVDLVADLFGEGVDGFVDETTRVDEVVGTTFELPFAEVTVTSYAGPVVDDRSASTEDPVEQARLSDIGPADDYNTWSLGHPMKGSSSPQR
jgi:hypothetical protein